MKRVRTKLGVQVETVRVLTGEQLGVVVGGSAATSGTYSQANPLPLPGTSTKPSQILSHCLSGGSDTAGQPVTH